MNVISEMTIYQLCDISRMRMSKFEVDLNDQKGNEMNELVNEVAEATNTEAPRDGKLYGEHSAKLAAKREAEVQHTDAQEDKEATE